MKRSFSSVVMVGLLLFSIGVLAQTNDVNLVAWGWNINGQCDVPALPEGFPCTQVAGGEHHSLALISPVINVAIDIKPGSYPNSINLGSNGNVPVAIFSTPDFDATTIDPLTVMLAGAEVKVKGKGTAMSSFVDINEDGLLDIVVHVDTTALELSPGDTEAVLEGETFDGIPVRGTDSIRIVNE